MKKSLKWICCNLIARRWKSVLLKNHEKKKSKKNVDSTDFLTIIKNERQCLPLELQIEIFECFDLQNLISFLNIENLEKFVNFIDEKNEHSTMHDDHPKFNLNFVDGHIWHWICVKFQFDNNSNEPLSVSSNVWKQICLENILQSHVESGVNVESLEKCWLKNNFHFFIRFLNIRKVTKLLPSTMISLDHFSQTLKFLGINDCKLNAPVFCEILSSLLFGIHLEALDLSGCSFQQIQSLTPQSQINDQQLNTPSINGNYKSSYSMMELDIDDDVDRSLLHTPNAKNQTSNFSIVKHKSSSNNNSNNLNQKHSISGDDWFVFCDSIQSNSSLTRLTLNGCGLNENLMENLLSAIKQRKKSGASNLKWLDLEGNCLSNETSIELLSKTFFELHFLNLNNCQISEYGMIKICHALFPNLNGNLSNLEELHLGGNLITNRVMESIIKSFDSTTTTKQNENFKSNLKIFNFSRSQSNDNESKKIYLSMPIEIHFLCQFLEQLLNPFPKLSVLFLENFISSESNNNGSRVGGFSLSTPKISNNNDSKKYTTENLKQVLTNFMNKLDCFSLAGCDFGEKLTCLISSELLVNAKISRFSMERNRWLGFSSTFRSILVSLPKLSASISNLCLDGNAFGDSNGSQLIRALCNVRTIRTLSMSSCDLGRKCDLALFELLSSNNGLVELVVDRNFLTFQLEPTTMALPIPTINQLNSTLERISASFQQTKFIGIHFLEFLNRTCKSIKSIILHDNEYSGSEFSDLLEFLNSPNSLKHFVTNKDTEVSEASKVCFIVESKEQYNRRVKSMNRFDFSEKCCGIEREKCQKEETAVKEMKPIVKQVCICREDESGDMISCDICLE